MPQYDNRTAIKRDLTRPNIHSIVSSSNINVRNSRESVSAYSGTRKFFRAPIYTAHRTVIFAIAHCSAFLS